MTFPKITCVHLPLRASAFRILPLKITAVNYLANPLVFEVEFPHLKSDL